MSVEDFVREVVPVVPTLDGAKVGQDRWEGHTDNQLKVEVYRRTGEPGLAVYWAYTDAGDHKIQDGRRSVKARDMAGLAKALIAAAGAAVPNRFVDEVERRAAVKTADPLLGKTAELLALDDPALYGEDAGDENTPDPLLPRVEYGLKEAVAGGLTREAVAEGLEVLPEAAAREQAEGQAVVYSTPAQVAAAQQQDEAEHEQPDPDVEAPTDQADE